MVGIEDSQIELRMCKLCDVDAARCKITADALEIWGDAVKRCCVTLAEALQQVKRENFCQAMVIMREAQRLADKARACWQLVQDVQARRNKVLMSDPMLTARISRLSSTRDADLSLERELLGDLVDACIHATYDGDYHSARSLLRDVGERVLDLGL